MIDRSLLFHPNVSISLLMVFADAIFDGILISIALKTSISPLWIFLTFLSCQALSLPIQEFLSDYLSRKKSILFAVITGMLAIILAREVHFDEKIYETSVYSLNSLMGLSSFAASIQIFIILCGKGIFANLTVIARAAIAGLCTSEVKI